jgi:hypothetical protein
MSLSPVRQPSARETVSSAKSVTVCPVPLSSHVDQRDRREAYPTIANTALCS